MREAKIRMTVVPGYPEKKLVIPHPNREKPGMVVCSCHPTYSRKYKIGGLLSSSAWEKKEKPTYKIPKQMC
jgi:hypothetical protein